MKNILFLGIGNMGGAIANALGTLSTCVKSTNEKPNTTANKNANNNNPAYTLFAVDPYALPKQDSEQEYITTFNSIAEASASINVSIDIIIIAVKPQVIEQVLSSLAQYFKNQTIIISTVAGVPIDYINKKLSSKQLRIARIMPTLAAKNKESLTGLCYSNACTDEDKALILEIINSIGKTIVLSEHQMSAITGVSGSGIAFVTEFIRNLSMAGVREGLSHTQAYTAALQTVKGALSLLEATQPATSDHAHTHALFESPQELINAICSPGGTTIEGISALHEHGFADSIFKAVHAASIKSDEFTNKFK